MKRIVCCLLSIISMFSVVSCSFSETAEQTQSQNTSNFDVISDRIDGNGMKKTAAKQGYDEIFEDADIEIDGQNDISTFSTRTDWSLKSYLEDDHNSEIKFAILKIMPENYEFYVHYGTAKAEINGQKLKVKSEHSELECSKVEIVKKFGDFDIDLSGKLIQRNYTAIDPSSEYLQWFLSEYGTETEDGHTIQDGTYYHNKDKLKELGINKIKTGYIPILEYGKEYYVFAAVFNTVNGDFEFYPIACCDDKLKIVSSNDKNIVCSPNWNYQNYSNELIEMIKEYEK